MSLLDASREGRRQGLEALRDTLATSLEVCESARDVAALSQRLMDVLKQLDEIGAEQAASEETSTVDEFTERRRRRVGA